MNIIDLRSDTVTRPSKQMMDAMYNAPVGDDVYGEDPTVNELENKMAGLFGMEAGLFAPSGIMTNQLAIKAHTKPGDEVICHRESHIYNYEGGGIAFHSAASVRLMFDNRGRFAASDILPNINPEDVHYPRTTLVSVENTTNRGGGAIYDLAELEKMSKICKDNKLKFHADGARLFNALVATGQSPAQHGAIFDSISICLSKGLGAPIGSVLLGNKAFIHEARHFRRMFGGGMRQAGILAAACIYALDNNVNRLADDHTRAKQLETILLKLPYVKSVLPVETNIVIFYLKDEVTDSLFLSKLNEMGIKASRFGPQTIRFVTHLDFTDDMLARVENVLLHQLNF